MSTKINFRELRKTMDLNQQEFWAAVWVTQSGGSRYESGRTAPRQVAEQVRLRHQLGIDTSLITVENADRIKAILDSGKASDERAD